MSNAKKEKALKQLIEYNVFSPSEVDTMLGALDNPSNENFQLVNAQKAADILGVSRMSVHRWRKQGKLPVHMIFGNPRFAVSELKEIASPETKSFSGGCKDEA